MGIRGAIGGNSTGCGDGEGLTAIIDSISRIYDIEIFTLYGQCRIGFADGEVRHVYTTEVECSGCGLAQGERTCLSQCGCGHFSRIFDT